MCAGALGAGACKTEKVEVPDPKTAQDLQGCRSTLSEQKKVIDELKSTNAQLALKQGAGSGSGAELVVSIQEDGPGKCSLVVKPPQPGEVRYAVNDKAAEAGAAEFYSLVNRSRGEIQKCYEQVLKKNTGLQSKEQTLIVSASFANGAIQGTPVFTPSLGGAFDSCMTAIATKWKLEKSSGAPMTFRAPVSLKPS
ncbi:MAG: hypothetical protein KF773_35285 [Deltaproteobacteria bacterium]|nr:hypothetical protein [Deltaproteobacteria bacterium]MCW5805335.1 hypothetical protein [Deltaproteobacteria bacterium]